MNYSYRTGNCVDVATAVKKTISLPPDVSKQLEEIAETVVQDALRLARREYLKQEYSGIQAYSSRKARGISAIEGCFDTNVFLSAFVFPGSRADAAIKRVLDGVDELVISSAMIDELLTVLARKFARDADELGRIAIFLTDLGEVVRP